MIRRLLLLFVLAAFPTFLIAQAHQADDIAHGSEKVASEAAHPAAAHGGAETEPTFLGFPAWIFKLVNMFLFLGALVYFIGGPVKRAIAERHAGIQSAAAEARAHRAKADQVAGDIQARLAQLEKEVVTIRERAQQEGERQKAELLAAAEAEASRILASARSEVENRLKNARQELTEYAGQLASDRAEQILRERITPQDQAKLFQDSLRAVDEVQS